VTNGNDMFRCLTIAFVFALGAAPLRGDESPIKPVVAVSGDNLSINGKSFDLPYEKKDFIAALGKPDRESKLANGVLIWDDLGLFACVHPQTGRITSVSIALGRDSPSFWPQKSFTGTLTVDGAAVSTDSTLTAINNAKKGKPFEKDTTDADTVSIERKSTVNYLRKNDTGRFVELTIEAKDE
jgi:hypothetical protein